MSESELINKLNARIARLEKSEEELLKFQQLIRQNPNMVIITDASGKIEYLNEQAESGLALSLEKIKGKPYNLRLAPGQDKSIEEDVREALVKGKVYKGEMKTLTEDGREIWVRAILTPIRKNRRIISYATILDDITAEKELQRLHSEEQLKYQTVVDNIPVALSLVDRRGKFWFVNRKSEEIMGQPSEVITRKTVRQLFKKEGPEIMKYIRQVFQEKKGTVRETTYLIKNTPRDFEMIRQPIFDRAGEVSLVMSIGTEITRRKKMEDLMKFQHSIDSLQSLSETFEKSLEMIFDNLFALGWVDAGGLYLFTTRRDILRLVYHRGLSEQFVKATGSYEYDTPIVQSILSGDCRFEAKVNYVTPTEQAILQEGLKFICVLPLVYKDEVIGSLNLASRTIEELDDFDKLTIESITGRLSNLIILIQTQEDLKKKNEELEESLENLQINRQMLVQKSRLESLGELLAGLAHEINQPLSIISLAVGNMEASLKQDEPDKDYIQSKFTSVMKNIDKIKELIEHVRIFSRDQTEMRYEQIDINLTIKNALSLVKEQLQHHRVEILLNLDESIGYTIGNASRLEQVFLNLVSNARDAMDEKDKMGNSPGYSKRLEIRSMTSGKNVIVTFRDNGTGMPPEILDRMFDPFFTTKLHRHGTGLGLPIVYGIIREMKGEITANSAPGEYTELIISLPAPIRKQKKERPV